MNTESEFSVRATIWAVAIVSDLGGAGPEEARRLAASTGRMEMFYLTTHSTHFIYGYMASGIW